MITAKKKNEKIDKIIEEINEILDIGYFLVSQLKTLVKHKKNKNGPKPKQK